MTKEDRIPTPDGGFLTKSGYIPNTDGKTDQTYNILTKGNIELTLQMEPNSCDTTV